MVDERRGCPRIAAPIEVAVINNSGELCGRLANFNNDGLMLVSANKWQEGQMYSVVLKPESVVMEDVDHLQPLAVDIECLWVDVCGGMTWVGAQFIVLNPVHIVAVASWMKALVARGDD